VVGERNKTRRSWSITDSSQDQLEPLAASIAQSGSNSSSSSEHANSYISNDYPSLLSLESCSEGAHNWQSSRVHREDVLYRQTAHNDGANTLPQGQMSLPRFGTQISLDGMSVQGPNVDASYQQHQDFVQVTGGRKDALLSPISLLDADARMGAEPSKPSRSEEVLQSHRTRRRSGSRAERMITDVESLYEFGIRLAIFPEDPLLRKSLRRMKERFRGLARSGASANEDSSSQTDSDR
jgi:hypothetical protein